MKVELVDHFAGCFEARRRSIASQKVPGTPDSKGGDPSEWTGDLRVREWPL